MAITYPAGCDSPAQKTEFLYACQEILRHIHNLMSYWLHNDITMGQYNNPPLGGISVPAELQSIVNSAFTYLKNKYPYKVRLTMDDWDKFIKEDFTPRTDRICTQINIQRQLLKNSTMYEVKLSNM
jgi:hypothetical protein